MGHIICRGGGALFVSLFSTLVFSLPIELIFGLFYDINVPNPPPPPRFPGNNAEHPRGRPSSLQFPQLPTVFPLNALGKMGLFCDAFDCAVCLQVGVAYFVEQHFGSKKTDKISRFIVDLSRFSLFWNQK